MENTDAIQRHTNALVTSLALEKDEKIRHNLQWSIKDNINNLARIAEVESDKHAKAQETIRLKAVALNSKLKFEEALAGISQYMCEILKDGDSSAKNKDLTSIIAVACLASYSKTVAAGLAPPPPCCDQLAAERKAAADLRAQLEAQRQLTTNTEAAVAAEKKLRDDLLGALTAEKKRVEELQKLVADEKSLKEREDLFARAQKDAEDRLMRFAAVENTHQKNMAAAADTLKKIAGQLEYAATVGPVSARLSAQLAREAREAVDKL